MHNSATLFLENSLETFNFIVPDMFGI
jgi:hypothetical protein